MLRGCNVYVGLSCLVNLGFLFGIYLDTARNVEIVVMDVIGHSRFACVADGSVQSLCSTCYLTTTTCACGGKAVYAMALSMTKHRK
jgi:hypothetical protein